jgi:hypothetical protein
MPELPDYMYQREQQPDQKFLPDEMLYRRVPRETWDETDEWEDEDIALDCIEFPDMSVSRGKYGPMDAVRWEKGKLVDWGVIGFRVSDIPESVPFQGAFVYRMTPVHMPERKNYPHSEVQVFESPWLEPTIRTHITESALAGIPREAQQEWRELLRRQCYIILRPGEIAPSNSDS